MRIDESRRKIIRDGILKKFRETFIDGKICDLSTSYKGDRSIVSEIDLSVSELVKDVVLKDEKLSKYNFFSEEDHGRLTFPAVILDPIDGTKELVRGIPECTLSLAIMENEGDKGWGWIFNPFTGFEICSDNNFCPHITRHERTPIGFVSQSEWSDGIYKEYMSDDLIIYPKGSMAFKLFLLVTGACDFIVTMRPKSLWDIAAGTLLAWERGYQFFECETEVKSLDKQRYDGPLVWCRPEHREVIMRHFHK